jgi:hypothetical protein
LSIWPGLLDQQRLVDLLQLLVSQSALGRDVLDLELLGQEGGVDAGEGCRIFVANLLDRVEALAAAQVVRLVKCLVQRLK